MNTEARDKKLAEMLEGVVNTTIIHSEILKLMRLLMRLSYKEGYRAARDEAIRILSARQENDYDA